MSRATSSATVWTSSTTRALYSGLLSNWSIQVSEPLYGSMSLSTSSSPRTRPTRMYAKVLNASNLCGESTSAPISRVLGLNLRDDRADRLVDERDPDFVRPSHQP